MVEILDFVFVLQCFFYCLFWAVSVRILMLAQLCEYFFFFNPLKANKYIKNETGRILYLVAINFSVDICNKMFSTFMEITL